MDIVTHRRVGKSLWYHAKAGQLIDAAMNMLMNNIVDVTTAEYVLYGTDL